MVNVLAAWRESRASRGRHPQPLLPFQGGTNTRPPAPEAPTSPRHSTVQYKPYCAQAPTHSRAQIRRFAREPPRAVLPASRDPQIAGRQPESKHFGAKARTRAAPGGRVHLGARAHRCDSVAPTLACPSCYGGYFHFILSLYELGSLLLVELCSCGRVPLGSMVPESTSCLSLPWTHLYKMSPLVPLGLSCLLSSSDSTTLTRSNICSSKTPSSPTSYTTRYQRLELNTLQAIPGT